MNPSKEKTYYSVTMLILSIQETLKKKMVKTKETLKKKTFTLN